MYLGTSTSSVSSGCVCHIFCIVLLWYATLINLTSVTLILCRVSLWPANDWLVPLNHLCEKVGLARVPGSEHWSSAWGGFAASWILLAPESTHQGSSLLTTVKVWPLRVNLSYLKKISRIIVDSQALVMSSVSKTGGWKIHTASSQGPQLISFHWKGFKCLYFHVDSEQHVYVSSIHACAYVCVCTYMYMRARSISQSLSTSFTDVGFQPNPQTDTASLARRSLSLPSKHWIDWELGSSMATLYLHGFWGFELHSIRLDSKPCNS